MANRPGANLERENVITPEETLRWLQIFDRNPGIVDLGFVDLDYRLRANGGRRCPVTRQWFKGNRPVPLSDVLDNIEKNVEVNFGFTPTREEVRYIESKIAARAQADDPLSQFMRQFFLPASGHVVPLDVIWQTWRTWAKRDRISEAELRSRMVQRGLNIWGEELVGWRKRST